MLTKQTILRNKQETYRDGFTLEMQMILERNDRKQYTCHEQSEASRTLSSFAVFRHCWTDPSSQSRMSLHLVVYCSLNRSCGCCWVILCKPISVLVKPQVISAESVRYKEQGRWTEIQFIYSELSSLCSADISSGAGRILSFVHPRKASLYQVTWNTSHAVMFVSLSAPYVGHLNTY